MLVTVKSSEIRRVGYRAFVRAIGRAANDVGVFCIGKPGAARHVYVHGTRIALPMEAQRAERACALALDGIGDYTFTLPFDAPSDFCTLFGASFNDDNAIGD